MAKNCKYQKYQKYVSYDNGATWQPMQEFQKGELIEASSTDCGGGTVVYQWVVDSYYCNNSDRYATEKKQVSYNNGQSWEDVVPTETKSTLVERNSPYCGSYQYRWVESGTTCIGYDKWQNNIRQVSRDGGQTWENVSPPEYSASTVIEYNSEDCGYVPPTPVGSTKWVATYSDSHTESAQCDSSSATTEGEIERANLIGIEIGNCVKNIGRDTFQFAESLTSVTIGSNVETIGDEAFYRCTSLTSITIPDSVTTIDEQAFLSCWSLVSVTIPESVTSIGDQAFAECYSLSSITLPSGLTSISESLFWNCSGLTSINIPSGVTSIGYAAFDSCRSLTSVTIPDSVTSIGEYAFFICSALTSVSIGSGVTAIGQNAFNGGISITSLTITAPTPPAIGSKSVNGTYPIYVPCSSVDAYKSASVWSAYANRIQGIPPCGEPPTPPTPSYKWIATYTGTGGTTSSAQCDSSSAITSGEINKTDLVSVEIGDCVSSIGRNAFDSCTSLTSITIPSSVTFIGYAAFNNCTSLSSVTIPDSVTSISTGAFEWCEALTSVSIGSGVTAIEQDAFWACPSLTSMTITAPTPPIIRSNSMGGRYPIYVPSGSVETYKSAYKKGWSEDMADRIQPIPNS